MCSSRNFTDAYASNTHTTKLLATLAIQSPTGHFTLEEGIIRYKGKVWVGHSASIQLQILQTLHSGSLGGHSSFRPTYKRIKELFV
jgi:hypothetical protein